MGYHFLCRGRICRGGGGYFLLLFFSVKRKEAKENQLLPGLEGGKPVFHFCCFCWLEPCGWTPWGGPVPSTVQ
jgi:hypothetical protein